MDLSTAPKVGDVVASHSLDDARCELPAEVLRGKIMRPCIMSEATDTASLLRFRLVCRALRVRVRGAWVCRAACVCWSVCLLASPSFFVSIGGDDLYLLPVEGHLVAMAGACAQR